jgi:hypothetical protein
MSEEDQNKITIICYNHSVIEPFYVSKTRTILKCVNCGKEVATWES